MVSVPQAAAVAEAAAPPPGPSPPPKAANARALYNKALTLVSNSAREASRQLAVDLVATTLDPVLTASVSALQTAIGAEVTRIMTMSPAQLAANPSPDPNMAAIVSGMKTRLDASKTALSGTGMDPLGVSGGTSPAQDVTYSYQGLMGSNASAEVRGDQFQGLADAFNSKLASIWEKKFQPEVKYVPESVASGPSRALAGPQIAPGPQKQTTAADPARNGGNGIAAALGFASVQFASGAADPPPSYPLTPDGVLALQRMVGNRAVTAAIERTNSQRPFLQRVSVSYGGTGETLYNDSDKSGKATANHYGGSGTFQLTRDGDAGVNLEVRVRFLKQARNTMPKRRGHPSDPDVGDLTGPQTVLPAGDQAWATQMA